MNAHEAITEFGPIETLYREFLRREDILRALEAPEEVLPAVSNWADEALNEAAALHPTTSREWAALVLAITEPNGTSIDWDILDQATAHARKTIGVEVQLFGKGKANSSV